MHYKSFFYVLVNFALIFILQNSGNKKEDAWLLNRIEITNTAKKKTWSFFCYQWLSLFHGDGHSERKLFPHKLVKTGIYILYFCNTLIITII